MNIFGIGLPEMAVIAAIALLVFGPKRLPEMGKTLGRTLKGFQSASQEFEQEFRSALRTADDDTLTLAPPPVPPATALTPQGDVDLEDGVKAAMPSASPPPTA
jgi:sec-independent protein translocase protein TatA